MITSKVTYIGKLRTVSVHRASSTEIITDAPVDNKGKGESFSPTDLVANSLACCMLTIIGISEEAYNFSIDGASAEVTKIMKNNPRQIEEIVINVTMPHANYSEKQRKFFELTAKTCPVARSLNPEIKQSVNFIYPQQ